jgi:hypothetical protein
VSYDVCLREFWGVLGIENVEKVFWLAKRFWWLVGGCVWEEESALVLVISL